MPKFYAVKNGYHIGIFNTWEECSKEVKGFSGAQYKSFTSRDEAEAFIKDTASCLCASTDNQKNTAVAYVDGSYNIKTKEFSYGAVIFFKEQEIKLNEKFNNEEDAKMRNVAGEIYGSMRAMRFCIENNIKELILYYDYAGIENWCTGAWKTNKPGTTAYKEYYDKVKQSVKIAFRKVKGHSGNEYNDMADRLAKDALGIK